MVTSGCFPGRDCAQVTHSPGLIGPQLCLDNLGLSQQVGGSREVWGTELAQRDMPPVPTDPHGLRVTPMGDACGLTQFRRVGCSEGRAVLGAFWAGGQSWDLGRNSLN